jgi:hypothetical protein
MFQRQAREPFPIRNIIILALIVLTLILFVVSQRKSKEPLPPRPATEQPAN